MNNIKPEAARKTIITVTVDASMPLELKTVAKLNEACKAAEDMGQDSVLVIHVLGGKSQTNLYTTLPHSLDIRLITKWEKALRRLERLTSVSIAIIEHICGFFALDVLLASDYRIAAKDLMIYLTGPSDEVWPGMSIYRLVNQIGIAQSKPFILFGKKLTIEEAIKLKLIDDAADNTSIALEAFFNLLNTMNLNNISVRRQLLLETNLVDFEDALGKHLAACDRTLRQTNPQGK